VFLLCILALALIGAALALVARAVALPRIQAAERVQAIQAYGFSASEVVAGPEPKAPTFSELAQRVGGVLSARFGSFQPERVRTELLAAGIYRMSPTTLLGYQALAAAIMAVSALMMASGMPALLAVVAVPSCTWLGWAAPMQLVRRRARLRLARIDHELPNLIDLLVVTVEAGLGLGASLNLAVSRLHGPLADEVRLALQEQRMGRSLSEALEGILARADTQGTRSFVRSVTQGESLGVSVGTIMRNLAADARKRQKFNAEEAARKAPVKMLFPLVFLILPAFGLVILGPALFEIGKSFGN
jgi:tight adherence protein C